MTVGQIFFLNRDSKVDFVKEVTKFIWNTKLNSPAYPNFKPKLNLTSHAQPTWHYISYDKYTKVYAKIV